MATYDLKYPGAAIDAILDTAYHLQQAGYIFRGSASDYSGTPTEREWVIAPAGFTGLGLSSAVPKGSIGICLYNGTSWTGKIINVLTLDSQPTRNSQNGVTSGGVAATLDKIADGIMATFASLLFDDETAAADLSSKLSYAVKFSVSDVYQTVTHLNILAATTSKAGLLSAADKVKIDSFLTNLRSLTFSDTTASADQGTQITETLKATIGGVQEVIDSITILAATSSKAGLLSASDKAYIDALPATLTSLSNSISGALALMQSLVGYYVCDTAAGTAAKTVAATGYSLTNGGCIRIKMDNANTANNVTLNINSTGAKALYYDGAQASATNTWDAGEVLEVYYDGTQYQCASGGGGKFATGEKVKDTRISDTIGNNGNLLTAAAVFPIAAKIDDAEGNAAYADVVTTWAKGSTRYDTGALVPDDNTIRTDYIDCTDIDTIVFGLSSLPSGMTYQCKPTWYTSNKTLVATPVWSDKGTADIEYQKPSATAAYVIFVLAVYNGNTQVSLNATNDYGAFAKYPYHTEWEGLLSEVSGFASDINDIETKINAAEGHPDVDIDTIWVNGSTYYTDGSLVPDNDKIRTDYIEVGQIGTFYANMPSLPSGYSYQCKPTWYNSSKVLLETAEWTSKTTGETAMGVPTGAYYVIVVAAAFNGNTNVSLSPLNSYGCHVYYKAQSGWNDLLEKAAEIEPMKLKIDEAEGIPMPIDGMYWEMGSTMYNDGSNADLTSNLRTSYVDCHDVDSFLITAHSLPSGYHIMCKPTWYNSSKALLVTPAWGGKGTTFNISVPSGAYYLRMVIAIFDSTDMQVDPVAVSMISTYSIVLSDTVTDWYNLLERVKTLEQGSDLRKLAPYHVKVASYNIGHYSHGDKTSHITAADYESQLAAYRTLVYSSLDADVIGLCEYSAIFGKNTDNVDVYAEDVLFNRYGFADIYEQRNYSCDALYSRVFISDVHMCEFECNRNAVITHTNLIQATDYYYIESNLWLAGKKVILVMAHLAFDLNNPQIVNNQMAELISKYADEERVVLMGDWNVTDVNQYNAFITAGYTLGNDGTIMTHPDTNPNKALDNIIVKGMDISNVGVIQTSGLSDHLPIYATITLP